MPTYLKINRHYRWIKYSFHFPNNSNWIFIKPLYPSLTLNADIHRAFKCVLVLGSRICTEGIICKIIAEVY